jgi:hypothetical protein
VVVDVVSGTVGVGASVLVVGASLVACVDGGDVGASVVDVEASGADGTVTGSTASAGAALAQVAPPGPAMVVVGAVQSIGGSGPADAEAHATTGSNPAAARTATVRLTVRPRRQR